MKIVSSPEILSQLKGAIMAIGVFDGIHLGHQAIIRSVVEQARTQNGTSVVLTFHPHPQKVISSGDAPKLIQTQKQKESLLFKLGVAIMIRMPFTRNLSLKTPEEFANKILAYPGLQEVAVGENFQFGHRRSGDVSKLRALGKKLGFDVREVSSVHYRNQRISSSRTRALIASGNVSLASRLLGRPYRISGFIVRGAALGEKLGFPTANLETENELLPASGVYVTKAQIGGDNYQSVTNVGLRPTVDEHRSDPVVETHLLDTNQDLYGQQMDLKFRFRLRSEQKFADLEALKSQIRLDKTRSQKYFKRLLDLKEKISLVESHPRRS